MSFDKTRLLIDKVRPRELIMNTGTAPGVCLVCREDTRVAAFSCPRGRTCQNVLCFECATNWARRGYKCMICRKDASLIEEGGHDMHTHLTNTASRVVHNEEYGFNIMFLIFIIECAGFGFIIITDGLLKFYFNNIT